MGSDGYYYSRLSKCTYTSSEFREAEYVDGFIFNKVLFTQFNSTLGYYVGFNDWGVKNAEYWNNNTELLEGERSQLETVCKYNADPQVTLNLVEPAGGRHPAMLFCSAYSFYPKIIKVTWLRNGQPVTSDVTSTEETNNGDWYYQIHSHLEYTAKSGEKISCVVEHPSATRPIILNWDNSLPEPDRSRIAIGASGLMLGIIIGAAGLIFYKKKSSIEHEGFQFVLCSNTRQEFLIGADDEELWHVNFDQKRGVKTLPDFSGKMEFPGFYKRGLHHVQVCKSHLEYYTEGFNTPTPEMDVPQTSIFPKYDVQLSVQNSLVCHVTGFYPPSVNISWTKNNVKVTKGQKVSLYRPKEDGTFNIFSTLQFTPAEGDIYSCTVSHSALQGQPVTKFWDVDIALPSVGPSVFCGVGLSFGILGIAIGIFSFVKGMDSNYTLANETQENMRAQENMSLLKLSSGHLIMTLFMWTGAVGAAEYYTARWSKCIYSSQNFSDMFNSSVGKFVGYTEFGLYQAKKWNNSTFLQEEIHFVDSECSIYVNPRASAIQDQTVKPTVTLSSVTQANGRLAMLICSAYEFYPQKIKVYWVRDGKAMTSEVTSTMEMADGDWYYQIHSELEYTPKPGEKISCVVEHASSSTPMVYDWDPSLPYPERIKMALGWILADSSK
ncbi:hypothetical protein DNTS_003773 [Danionella cerebrum]|uniref:Ig-like domain-containing protein n=1 Tax=Danionella cerebrum TaxID=2873325 RepID=A0A553NKL9_9TELE|nr:hypothetical protein DNTS_003773 [Danionella translucida]